MVVANTPRATRTAPWLSRIILDRERRDVLDDSRIGEGKRASRWTSGKVTCGITPSSCSQKHLGRGGTIRDTVAAGKVIHKLKVGKNDQLEALRLPG